MATSCLSLMLKNAAINTSSMKECGAPHRYTNASSPISPEGNNEATHETHSSTTLLCTRYLRAGRTACVRWLLYGVGSADRCSISSLPRRPHCFTLLFRDTRQLITTYCSSHQYYQDILLLDRSRDHYPHLHIRKTRPLYHFGPTS